MKTNPDSKKDYLVFPKVPDGSSIFAWTEMGDTIVDSNRICIIDDDAMDKINEYCDLEDITIEELLKEVTDVI